MYQGEDARVIHNDVTSTYFSARKDQKGKRFWILLEQEMIIIIQYLYTALKSCKGYRGAGVAVASAGPYTNHLHPYTNHLHLATDR